MKRIMTYLFCMVLVTQPVWAGNSESVFGGVGIDGVPLKNGQIEVRQIVNGSPAHQAGIRTGDIITHIDGKPTMGSDFTTLVQKRLRGVSGTPVVLKISHAGEEKPLTFKLIRRQIVIVPNKEKK